MASIRRLRLLQRSRHGPGTVRDLEAIESSRTCTDSCTLSLHLISQIFDSLFRDLLPAS